MQIKVRTGDAPVASDYIAWMEVVELTGVHPTRLGELVEIGWIEAVRTSGDEYLFRRRDVRRLRKLERLCRDFELSSVGGSIIVDLLERIECLENKIRELERIVR